MTRSLCTWLASLALCAAPSVAGAQTLIGQSRLAPVALEARCQFTDGMLDGANYLVALGHDPLHLAVMEEDSCDSETTDSRPVVSDSLLPVGDAADVADSRDHEPFCPWADLAEYEPIDVEPILATDVELSPSSHEIPLATLEPVAPVSKLAGAGPVVALLREEYLPYDFTQPLPIRIDLMSVRIPLSTPVVELGALAKDAKAVATEVAVDEPPVSEGDGISAESVTEVAVDTMSADEQMRALEDAFQSLMPQVPFACWIEDLAWQADELLGDNGPVRPWLDLRNVGGQVVELTRQSLDVAVEVSHPMVPVLIQPTRQAPPQPAFQPSELVLAANALHTAASELESLASRIRGLGDSLHRVAQVNETKAR